MRESRDLPHGEADGAVEMVSERPRSLGEQRVRPAPTTGFCCSNTHEVQAGSLGLIVSVPRGGVVGTNDPRAL